LCGDLIDAQNANERRKVTEQARIEAERALLHAEGRAAAIVVISKAKAERERVKFEALAAALSGEGGDRCLDLERARSYADAEKLIVVPTDAKIVLPAFNHVEE
jgi:regulator of protease activity HflC (stomatin/prohibitin superfamily)